MAQDTHAGKYMPERTRARAAHRRIALTDSITMNTCSWPQLKNWWNKVENRGPPGLAGWAEEDRLKNRNQPVRSRARSVSIYEFQIRLLWAIDDGYSSRNSEMKSKVETHLFGLGGQRREG